MRRRIATTVLIAFTLFALRAPAAPARGAPDARLIDPIGFSRSGALAFRQTNPDCGCDAGVCRQWIPMCGYDDEPEEQCLERCLPEEGHLVDLESGEVLKSGRLPAAELAASGVEKQDLRIMALPHEHAGDVYSIERQGCAEIGDLEGDWEVVQECALFLVSKRRGRKKVYSFRSRELRGFHLEVGGALFSPFEPRMAILLRQGDAPFEDEGPSRLFFVGARLEDGFVREDPKPAPAVPARLLGSWRELRLAPDGSFFYEPECGPDSSVSYRFERDRVYSVSSGAADRVPFDDFQSTDSGIALRKAGMPDLVFRFVGAGQNVFRVRHHSYGRQPFESNPSVSTKEADCSDSAR